MSLSLDFIIKKPEVLSKNPSLVLLLHGYGSNEEDLFSFAQELPDSMLIISARAPQSLGFGGYSWYGLQIDAHNNTITNIQEAKEAKALLALFIDELQEKYHFNPIKSFLIGFSQGAILSYSIALSFPHKINNIIALSGYLNKDITTISEETSIYTALRFFVSHGTEDPIIPVQLARETESVLTALHINHIYKEYPDGHSVSSQNFIDFTNWLIKILAT